jgi:hypothetical protein
MQTSSLAYADTEPVRLFARKRGISPTKVYRWIEEGELESFLDGNRRHVVVSSYDRMVRRMVAEQEGGKAVKLPSSNPKAKSRDAVAASARSVKRVQSTSPPRQQYRTTSRRPS